MSLLQIDAIDVFYGPAQALWGVSFSVEKGQVAALIGANGAGKTTTLKALCGLIPLATGRVTYDGQVISGMPVHRIMDLGISLIPEGRQLFPKMTVEENLTIGSYLERTKPARRANLERVYHLFPRLAERRLQTAETMSGGEQQMLAIGRALMQEPRVLILDEPSLGLAPTLVREIFGIVKELHGRGLTILLVEQNVHQALQVADVAFVLENGRVIMSGAGSELIRNPRVKEAYLGF
ncbi:MAG TPA: ABC transporter ATP-binding protein [Candidatus Methylomirabilis sp.]|nr:ABC transporter ATP-binding protein [Candidatus Methylomirabilis sp.]